MAFSIICYYYYYCYCCCCLLLVNNVIIINTTYYYYYCWGFLQGVNSILSLIADELFQSSGVTVRKALVNTSCINILLPSPYI